MGEPLCFTVCVVSISRIVAEAFCGLVRETFQPGSVESGERLRYLLGLSALGAHVGQDGEHLGWEGFEYLAEVVVGGRGADRAEVLLWEPSLVGGEEDCCASGYGGGGVGMVIGVGPKTGRY